MGTKSLRYACFGCLAPLDESYNNLCDSEATKPYRLVKMAFPFLWVFTVGFNECMREVVVLAWVLTFLVQAVTVLAWHAALLAWEVVAAMWDAAVRM